jgi:hypothetical protein
MRTLISPRFSSVRVATVLAVVLVIGSAASVAAKRPPAPTPPPPSTSPSITIEIAPTGTVEPTRVYATIDVTVTCPVGWTWHHGYLYVLRGDLGGSGTFSASCTGTPQVVRSRVVNGNHFALGDWTATAYVGITRSGQQATASSTRTIQIQPEVTARMADQGQLTGTAGSGAKVAVDVACPTGAAGVPSHVALSQDGALQGSAPFTPICDGRVHTFVLSIAASHGTFHTGAALADAFATVDWNGQGFYGFDSRTVTLLESSTGDTTPPTTPSGLSANVFGDGETWLSWGASTDNATPTGLIVYDVFLNGQFDQGIGRGYTQAILYAEVGVLNTVDVVAVDGAGNRSAPATTTVDLR